MPVSKTKQSGRRLTRCRTGCMKCRMRRRKCDEGKPRCRNCVDRNFQCQYGPQLTFLTKNAHTVQSAEVGSTSNSYEAIRFVNEGPSTTDYVVAVPPETPTVEETAHIPSPRKPGQEVALPLQADGIVAHPKPQPPITALNDNDESAVAGLLALGTSSNDTISPNMSLAEFGLSPARAPSQGWTPRFSDPSALYSPSLLSQASPNDHTLPTEALELLRHYRYEVASYLDICDLGQMFGIRCLQLAMESQPLWNSILSLSKASKNSLNPSTSIDSDPDESLPANLHQEFTTTALLRLLSFVRESTAHVSNAWISHRSAEGEIQDELSHHAMGRNLNAAIYWMFLRLDLAAALAMDTNIKTPLPPSPPYFPDGDFGTDPFEQVFCFAHRPLWLCARAVEFMHNENPSPQCPPLHSWMQLVEQLEQWYHERPQGFQPMMELDMEDQSTTAGPNFPVVLFANGAGVFSNQLYHTAMLLLLHSRPRTARIADFPSTTMSPLWHAQRICSIALNNDRRECWDSCLLASFLLSSRGMTHEAQQQEILHGFRRIQGVTGWDAGDFLRGLREEWSLLEI